MIKSNPSSNANWLSCIIEYRVSRLKAIYCFQLYDPDTQEQCILGHSTEAKSAMVVTGICWLETGLIKRFWKE